MKTIHLRTLLPMAALLMPIFASGKTNISVQFRTSGGFHSHDRSSSYSYHQISRPSCPPPRATCPPPRPACPPNQSFRGHPRQQGPVIHHHHYQGLGSRYHSHNRYAPAYVPRYGYGHGYQQRQSYICRPQRPIVYFSW